MLRTEIRNDVNNLTNSEVNNESNNETNDEMIIDNENNMVDNEKDNNDEANNSANSFHEEEATYNFSMLKVGYTFKEWSDVDSFFKTYGQYYGFAIIKKRVERSNGIIKSRSLGCEFGGKYNPKKSIDINTHHNRRSKRQECQWHINLNFSKDINCITVTTFVDDHNHELHPEACKYSVNFRSIGNDALNDIEFYTKKGNLSISDESIGDHFIEDVYDARQILVRSMIAKVGQENVQEIWQITDKRPGNNKRKHFIIVIDPISYLCTSSRWYYDFKREANEQLNVIFANENAIHVQQNQIIPTIPQPLSVPCSVTANNRHAAARRTKFGELWGLHFLTNNQKDDKSTNESDYSEEEDNSSIINPLVTKRKGRRETKRYKSALEKARRQPYSCRTCGQIGHNNL
ncbi:17010_t:CDS:2 [Gigaspora margarita]|uniref:17010_t:CDS:1 n=1 Tax=Gigaspora margarita TaxID=4874 RepID=A0ABN7VAN4_GIGMA|nr:17010_t:CDS:2 [Gigaspora margarita]